MCEMIYIFLVLLFTGSSAQKFATDDVEKFFIDALNNNETFDYDFENSTEKPCQPYEPIKPNFNESRISESKCKEYIWEMEMREKEQEWGDRCRLYLIMQIKKEIIPEILFIINSPVIFGGRGAKPKEFPHMGAVGWRAKNKTEGWIYKCGSTLISDTFLLTAAHCSKLALSRANDVINAVPEVVMLGLENLENNQFNIHGAPTLQEIERIHVHPLYVSPKKYHDIALIEMKTKVKIDAHIQPACLWSRQDIETRGENTSLTGWGATESGASSSLLQVAIVDILKNSECDVLLQETHNRNWKGFTDTQICAGKLEGGIDTCQGDSGGPLQVIIPTETIGKIYRIMGVTSFGIKCGVKNKPGVYTRVSSYVDWIEEKVWGKPEKVQNLFSSNVNTDIKKLLMRERKKESSNTTTTMANNVIPLQADVFTMFLLISFVCF